MPAAPEMKDHVYKILDLAGSSDKSIEDAIQNAITRASKTIREMKWFEVMQTRGHIENGTVRHYQVVLRVKYRDVLAKNGLRHLRVVSQHLAHDAAQIWPVRGGGLAYQGIAGKLIDKGVERHVRFDLLV